MDNQTPPKEQSPLMRLKAFFGHKSREVTLPEMTAFFKSLSEDEKNTFKTEIQNWDGQSEFITEVKAPLALPASTLEVAQA